jgi:hypothetical protein
MHATPGPLAGRADRRHDAYGFFGGLYSTSFWSGFQTVS